MLPPLRDIIKKFGLRAKSSLGQNFLLDSNIHKRIARAVAPEDARVMEIGAGPGGLTRELLASHPKKLFAVELDERAIGALTELQQTYPRLEVIKGNALKINFEDYHLEKITGNLPFNISSPLLALWLLAPKPSYKKIVVLVQKEVAQRMVASANTKSFSRLSVLCQWRGSAKILFTLRAQAFTPVPKVDSALVEITLTPQPDDPTPTTLEWVSRLAFSQRRKMLRTHAELRAVLSELNIDSTLRAEQLSVEQYKQIARRVQRVQRVRRARRP